MDKVWSDLVHRHKHKLSLVESRVGNREERRVGMHIAEEQQIKVDRPRFFHRLISAAEKVFNSEQPRHHLRRGDCLAADLCHHIEEGKFAFESYRFGLVYRREFDDKKASLDQATYGIEQIPGPITEVRSDSYVGCDSFRFHVESMRKCVLS